MNQAEFYQWMITAYPRDALEFFAPAEAARIPRSARLTPVPGEHKIQEVGQGQWLFDVPLRIQYPDGSQPPEVLVLRVLLQP